MVTVNKIGELPEMTPEFEAHVAVTSEKIKQLMEEAFGPQVSYIMQFTVGDVGCCIIKEAKEGLDG